MMDNKIEKENNKAEVMPLFILLDVWLYSRRTRSQYLKKSFS
ncbi:MAG: hypothetical protein RIR96_1630, partial [Bacteroidota bacterium]